ncbi:hypothetical protein CU102_03705 [Phyllobacterium brassicacearum]|uniref:Uncharacterized protein n=1 Tax=Phyllobacterium brassicacearum TaxID=314235 RepID=A0A2P7BUQ3_9HYPH|nr:hypothetical protein [Phyllobacterium brassicacearum]PSH70204.1 hypothetical protein CU102_03705 [Phyllobacterium brassicacearum]TDQ33907.1 hypothetical protein DEV91_104110 [Phyllobacterium brassicacearum]
MAQPINNVGSQQALESNWNDENAIQKFERARESASRERRDEILSAQSRPHAVELRARPSSADRKSGPDSDDNPLEPREHEAKRSPDRLRVKRNGLIQSPTSRELPRYLTGSIILLCAMALAVGLYLA